MSRKLIRKASKALSSFLVAGGCLAQEPIPDTPAGENLSAMLTALNSGDREALVEYAESYAPPGSADVDSLLQTAAQIGQVQVLDILVSERLSLEFVLEGVSLGFSFVGMLRVEDADPPRTSFSLPWTPVPRGANVIGFEIDGSTRQRAVEEIADRIADFYVLPAEALQMKQALDAALAMGGYDEISNGWVLANTLTEQLRAISRDEHLSVNFSPIAMGPPTAGPYTERPIQLGECGFGDVEEPQAGVGFVRVFTFADPGQCRQSAEAILRSLATYDVVVFDLTEALGGNWGMPGLILSHLLDTPNQISAMHWRERGRVQALQPGVPIEEVDLSQIDVYVLTSSRTFSGAEGFAYDLQAAGRAIIVGEVTRGGAHSPRTERIDERFSIVLPVARAVNPITRDNWEGSGVQPDVIASHNDALGTALSLMNGESPVGRTN